MPFPSKGRNRIHHVVGGFMVGRRQEMNKGLRYAVWGGKGQTFDLRHTQRCVWYQQDEVKLCETLEIHRRRPQFFGRVLRHWKATHSSSICHDPEAFTLNTSILMWATSAWHIMHPFVSWDGGKCIRLLNSSLPSKLIGLFSIGLTLCRSLCRLRVVLFENSWKVYCQELSSMKSLQVAFLLGWRLWRCLEKNVPILGHMPQILHCTMKSGQSLRTNIKFQSRSLEVISFQRDNVEWYIYFNPQTVWCLSYKSSTITQGALQRDKVWLQRYDGGKTQLRRGKVGIDRK